MGISSFRLLPRSLGRGGFVSSGIVSVVVYRFVSGERGIAGNWAPKVENTTENAVTREGAKIYRYRLLPRPRGGGGFVSFGLVYFVWYWYISGEGDFGK